MHDNKRSEECFESSYQHIVDVLSELNITKGVNLDLGCHLGLLYQELNQTIKYPLDYLGLSAQSNDIDSLNKKNIRAYVSDFSDLERMEVFLEKILEGRQIAAITIINMAESEGNTLQMLRFAHQIAKKNKAPLIISAQNATNKEVVLKLFEGTFHSDTLDFEKIPTAFTEDYLSHVMDKNNFKEIIKKDVLLEEVNQNAADQSAFIKEATMLSEYVYYVKDLIDKNASTYAFIRAYLPLENGRKEVSQTNDEKVFLSIVSRTQGKRKEELTEMLLCLTGQSNPNFELLILGHNLGAKEQADVEQIIEDLPQWMRKKTRLLKVDGGTRTTPLNVGFENAKGDYIVVLDDDDLVFDNWVEEFYRAAQENYGKVLHAYVISQDWESGLTPTEKSLRACGSPSNMYCKNFNYLDQMSDNHCPVIGVAFPAYAFQKLNIKFDENLTTTEDWDFLMRTVLICGVTDIEQPTSIYRRWKNAENSESLHNLDEWVQNKKIVGEKLNNMPILLPKGYADIIGKRFRSQERAKKGLLELDLSSDAQLFLDIGEGFSEASKVYSETSLDEMKMLKYTQLDRFGPISALRFDPTELAMIMVEALEIRITNGIGEIEKYYLKDIQTNGFLREEAILFFKCDPQIVLFFPEKKVITTVEISCLIYSKIPDMMIDEILDRNKRDDGGIYKKIKGIKARLRS